MYRNYLMIARRNLIRNKSFSSLNILGLWVGMAGSRLPWLDMQSELSYRRHPPS
ncbi:hypothetical protein [Salmonirosea aquatica]|uniref:hypothetical protein n=1 Tax=Salmonirosea aquatica TaxID=2654236 RepID=UPI003570CF7E